MRLQAVGLPTCATTKTNTTVRIAAAATTADGKDSLVTWVSVSRIAGLASSKAQGKMLRNLFKAFTCIKAPSGTHLGQN